MNYRSITTLAVLLLSLVLTGCTSNPSVHTSLATTERELVVAQGTDATSRTLGEAYRQILTDAGITARLAPPALDPITEVVAGRADVAVEGSSDLLLALSKVPEADADADASSSAQSAEEQPTALPGTPGVLDAAQTHKALHALRPMGLAVLDSADAQRTGTLVITQATSAAESLENLAQLGQLCHRLDVGVIGSAAAELSEALRTEASCTPKSVIELPEEAADGVSAVIGGQVQVQATTQENSGIPDNALVELNDTGKLFAPQVLTAVITTEGVGQDAIKAINKLTGELKQEDLLNLNRMVSGRDAMDPAKAATDWLRASSLVASP